MSLIVELFVLVQKTFPKLYAPSCVSPRGLCPLNAYPFSRSPSLFTILFYSIERRDDFPFVWKLVGIQVLRWLNSQDVKFYSIEDRQTCSFNLLSCYSSQRRRLPLTSLRALSKNCDHQPVIVAKSQLFAVAPASVCKFPFVIAHATLHFPRWRGRVSS